MTNTSVSTLPKEHRTILITAYSDYREAVRTNAPDRRDKGRRIAELFLAATQAKWPNIALGDVCGITGTSASRIINRYPDLTPATDVTFPTFEGEYVPATDGPPPPIQTRTLPAQERQKLYEVAAIARTCNGSRTLDHPSRIGSHKFSTALMTYHDMGITWNDLAHASGMKVPGVRMRAQRHGYNSGPPPSIPPYRGLVRPGCDKDSEQEPAKTRPARGKAEKTSPRGAKKKRGKKSRKKAAA